MDVQAMVIGSHNDYMVPLWRYTSVGGIPISEFLRMNMITMSDINKITQETREQGKIIVGLFHGDGSASYSPAASAVLIVSRHYYY